jgi:hypothetical protein
MKNTTLVIALAIIVPVVLLGGCVTFLSTATSLKPSFWLRTNVNSTEAERDAAVNAMSAEEKEAMKDQQWDGKAWVQKPPFRQNGSSTHSDNK